jgi:hypothetical protein
VGDDRAAVPGAVLEVSVCPPEFLRVTLLLWSSGVVPSSVMPRSFTITRAGSVPDARFGSGTPCVRVVTAPVSTGSDTNGFQYHGSFAPSGRQASSVSRWAIASKLVAIAELSGGDARPVIRDRLPASTSRK